MTPLLIVMAVIVVSAAFAGAFIAAAVVGFILALLCLTDVLGGPVE